MPTEDLFNAYSMLPVGQTLVADNTSPNMDEAQQARIKDPLWYLSRQWQTGEFEAENGGRPAHIDLQWQDHPVREALLGDTTQRVTPETPLDYAVEAEDETGTSSAWDSAAQEYRFAIKAGARQLQATDYPGQHMDWYHFDLDGLASGRFSRKRQSQRVVPTQLQFKGMPHPRWWRFEDASVFLDSGDDPEPNSLSMLLPEFTYIDANNWFIVPVEQAVGNLRMIQRLGVIDSFGQTSDLSPGIGEHDDDDWQVFTQSNLTSNTLKGQYMFVPNVANNSMAGDILEQVQFQRDENANLVWAVENWYTDADSDERIHRGNDNAQPAQTSVANPELKNEPAYRLRSPLADNWVPYIARKRDNSAASGETYLRRARSMESFDKDNPQYKGRLLSEAWKLYEEEVPSAGIRVQRLYRYTRTSDGEALFWIGRRKDVAQSQPLPGLKFDYLEEQNDVD